jgi:hypothetical protein
MKKLSKWFYLGSMIGGQVGGIVLLTAAVVILVVSGILTDYVLNLSHAGTWGLASSILLILLGCAAILFGATIWYLLLYRAWAAIQDGNASTTPEKAVGFIFIPFYNFYWIFKAWYGFARDYNHYLERYALNAPKLEESLFLAFCILFICAMVPVLNYLAGLPFLVIFIITANKTIDAVNSLLALQAGTINK